MTPLQDILAGLAEEDRGRIGRALALMNVQAVGSEKYREDVKSWTKEDKSPVTIADLLHQSQVQQMLKDHFAGDGLICEEPRAMQEQVIEEAAQVSSKYYGSALRPEVHTIPASGRVRWMLDPIDGTKGYLAGRYYAIALGFFRDGAPHFGAMAVPHAPRAERTRIDNAIAFAVVGRGAWIGSVSEQGALEFEPLRTERESFEKPYRIAVSLEHGGALSGAMESGELAVVKMDSQAKYLAVAANEMDAYLRKSRGDGGTDVTWDHMPGALIAREAGCTVASFDDSPIEFAPQGIVRFAGGMKCHRGAADGPVGRTVQRIIGAATGS